jgi:hypothetical protein
LKSAIDERLIVGLSDTDRVQDIVEVVRSQAIARALREEQGQGDQEQPLPIARSLQEYGPSVFRIELLQADGFLDLVKSGFDEMISWVSVCVILVKSTLFKTSTKVHVL